MSEAGSASSCLPPQTRRRSTGVVGGRVRGGARRRRRQPLLHGVGAGGARGRAHGVARDHADVVLPGAPPRPLRDGVLARAQPVVGARRRRGVPLPFAVPRAVGQLRLRRRAPPPPRHCHAPAHTRAITVPRGCYPMHRRGCRASQHRPLPVLPPPARTCGPRNQEQRTPPPRAPHAPPPPPTVGTRRDVRQRGGVVRRRAHRDGPLRRERVPLVAARQPQWRLRLGRPQRRQRRHRPLRRRLGVVGGLAAAARAAALCRRPADRGDRRADRAGLPAARRHRRRAVVVPNTEEAAAKVVGHRRRRAAPLAAGATARLGRRDHGDGDRGGARRQRAAHAHGRRRRARGARRRRRAAGSAAAAEDPFTAMLRGDGFADAGGGKEAPTPSGAPRERGVAQQAADAEGAAEWAAAQEAAEAAKKKARQKKKPTPRRRWRVAPSARRRRRRRRRRRGSARQESAAQRVRLWVQAQRGDVYAMLSSLPEVADAMGIPALKSGAPARRRRGAPQELPPRRRRFPPGQGGQAARAGAGVRRGGLQGALRGVPGRDQADGGRRRRRRQQAALGAPVVVVVVVVVAPPAAGDGHRTGDDARV